MAASPSVMAAGVGTSISRRVISMLIGLGGITFMTGALVIFNYYWLGLIFFFVSLLLLFSFSLEQYQYRNLVRFAVIFLFVIFLAGTLANDYWLNNPEANPFPGNNLFALLASVLIGIGAALIIVVIPFLWLVGIATAGILKWYENNENISFFDAYNFLLADVLGIPRVSIIVDDSTPKGKEEDLNILETFGGPGRLTVYPGRVVALHKWGRVTRIVGLGSTMLKRGEKIKAILSLGGQGDISSIENVLTRDRVPLTIKVLHVAQMETATETESRLQQIQEGDKRIGDEYDQCYESIAKLVATKAPKIWDSLKGPVTGNLKRVVMAFAFDELFEVNPQTQQLNIIGVRDAIFQAAEQAGINNGIRLRRVDIVEIQFPEEITSKLNKEITAHVDSRIKQEEARTEELVAQSEENAAGHRGNARITLAQAEAQAETFKARAKAAHYTEAIQALKRERQSDEAIETVVQNLASSAALETELKRLLELMVQYIKK